MIMPLCCNLRAQPFHFTSAKVEQEAVAGCTVSKEAFSREVLQDPEMLSTPTRLKKLVQDLRIHSMREATSTLVHGLSVCLINPVQVQAALASSAYQHNVRFTMGYWRACQGQTNFLQVTPRYARFLSSPCKELFVSQTSITYFGPFSNLPSTHGGRLWPDRYLRTRVDLLYQSDRSA